MNRQRRSGLDHLRPEDSSLLWHNTRVHKPRLARAPSPVDLPKNLGRFSTKVPLSPIAKWSFIVSSLSLPDPDDQPLPVHQLAGHLPSTATPATGPSPTSEPDDPGALEDLTPSEATHSSTQSTSQSETETSPLAYIYAPHSNLRVPFGRLQCIQNPRVSWSLAIKNDGRRSQTLTVGYAQGCEILVFGPIVGISAFGYS